jgi:hypothetical protein
MVFFGSTSSNWLTGWCIRRLRINETAVGIDSFLGYETVCSQFISQPNKEIDTKGRRPLNERILCLGLIRTCSKKVAKWGQYSSQSPRRYVRFFSCLYRPLNKKGLKPSSKVNQKRLTINYTPRAHRKLRSYVDHSSAVIHCFFMLRIHSKRPIKGRRPHKNVVGHDNPRNRTVNNEKLSRYCWTDACISAWRTGWSQFDCMPLLQSHMLWVQFVWWP